MKRFCVAAAALLACSASYGATVLSTGTLSGASVIGTGAWSGTTSFGWTVTQLDAPYNGEAGFIYEYCYTFTAPDPELSHLTIEVTEDPAFTLANIRNITGAGTPDIRVYDTSEPGSPGIPQDFYGAKFDTPDGDSLLAGPLVPSTIHTAEICFVSDRPPVWGDIYAKGGQVYAYNAGFVAADTALDHVAVPDGDGGGVPEPSSLALLGVTATLALRRRKPAEV